MMETISNTLVETISINTDFIQKIYKDTINLTRQR